jgi:C-terminal processing protease CtpA/Prc
MKLLGTVIVLTSLAALAIVVAPSVYGQDRRASAEQRGTRRFSVLGDREAGIGASVRDLEGSEVRSGGGVYVEDVRPDSPAAKAGLQPADIVTKFDGEAVRSARQFGRLVRETPAGRTVNATVLRDGRSMELSFMPTEGWSTGIYTDSGRLRGMLDQQRLQEQWSQLRDRIGRIPSDLNFDFDLPGIQGRSRLGVAVMELTPELATYFGAKDGVLVASVTADSPAARAGLKAGDVIASVNGQNVASRNDLMRVLRNAGADGDVTIGIVRDKKESSVKARLDDVRARRPLRRVRSTRPA